MVLQDFHPLPPDSDEHLPGPLVLGRAKMATWELTKILSKVLFAKLSKASACAKAAATNDPFFLNLLVLWASIKHHTVMKAFKEHNFEGHPNIQPKVLNYLG